MSMETRAMVKKLRDLAARFRDENYFPSMSFLASFLPKVADRLEELSKDGRSKTGVK